MRPGLLPDGHGRLTARRVRVISGDHSTPPLRAEDLFGRPANDDRTSLVVGLLILVLLIGACILLGVAAFMIGRAA
jgi:hypothetical protein